MKLTTPQIARFWKVFGAAWAVYSAGTGECGEEAKHSFRKAQLAECGFASLTDVDRTHGFDLVMFHFAQLAGDEATACYFAVAVERRMRFLIRDRLEIITKLTGVRHDWSYARGIMDHMHLAANIDDVPAEQLLKVFEALDTHLRRLKHKDNAKPHAPESHDGHHKEAA